MENCAAFVTDSYESVVAEGQRHYPPLEVDHFKGTLDIAEVMHLVLNLQREGKIKQSRED